MVDQVRKGKSRIKSKPTSIHSEDSPHHHPERDATPQPTTSDSPSRSIIGTSGSTSAVLEAPLIPGEDPHRSAFSSQFSNYIISPGGPLIADWDNTLSFSPFGTFYEPQGELALAIHQPNPLQHQDFAIPIPVCLASAASLRASTPVLPLPEVASSGRGSADPATDYRAPEMMATPRAGMKRKAASDTSLLINTGEAGPSTMKRPAAGRRDSSRTSTMQIPAKTPTPIIGERRSSTQPAETPQEGGAGGIESSRPEDSARASSRKTADVTPKLSPILPAGKVFPIRIGSELFQLSGASLSSDGKRPIVLNITKLTNLSTFVLFTLLW
jgi:hypothetical protein